ncbi:hypothetical protein HDA30_000206 [Micrococcus cohnii]|uniref:TrbL/VirB6 plasmid conjugal transfer protein n=1 Tax=Micrococcus cohnii TaxID=993416 RepID=A0A7W7GM77_9MICC|nr:hypothetical protein [Micrococcus cohnii]MBB4734698.1 hypothetical protein [Micrococcus cohnii]
MWEKDFQEWMNGSILGLAKAAWGLLKDSFAVGALTPEWWVSVVGGQVTTTVEGGGTVVVDHPGMLNIIVVAMLPLLIVFVVIQVVLSALRGSTAGMMRALVTAVFSVPFTYVTVGLVWLAMGATQAMTMWILEVGYEGSEGEDQAVSAVLNLFGLSYNGKDDEIILDENYAQWQMASKDAENGMILVAWLVALVIFIACFVLMAMMIFRTVVILLLASFAAPAIFSLALEPAKALAGRWLSMVIGLLMAAPVGAATIRLGMSMAALSTDWIQTVAGLVLVFVAAAMPLVMLSMVTWISGGSQGVEQAGVMAAGRAGRGVQNSMRGASVRAGRMSQRAASMAVRGGRMR